MCKPIYLSVLITLSYKLMFDHFCRHCRHDSTDIYPLHDLKTPLWLSELCARHTSRGSGSKGEAKMPSERFFCSLWETEQVKMGMRKAVVILSVYFDAITHNG